MPGDFLDNIRLELYTYMEITQKFEGELWVRVQSTFPFKYFLKIIFVLREISPNYRQAILGAIQA